MKRLCVATAVFLIVAASAPSHVARAGTPTVVQIAIPNNVDIRSHILTVIGRPTSLSQVNCAPGTPQPQTVVAVDRSGDGAAQITGVLVFHEHEVPLGSRYRITSLGSACNAELKLYTAELE